MVADQPNIPAEGDGNLEHNAKAGGDDVSNILRADADLTKPTELSKAGDDNFKIAETDEKTESMTGADRIDAAAESFDKSGKMLAKIDSLDDADLKEGANAVLEHFGDQFAKIDPELGNAIRNGDMNKAMTTIKGYSDKLTA